MKEGDVLNLKKMKLLEDGIMFTISLRITSILLPTKNWVGAALARSPLILMMCWKIGKIGCIKSRLENVG